MLRSEDFANCIKDVYLRQFDADPITYCQDKWKTDSTILVCSCVLL